MVDIATAVLLQTATPPPGAGPEELVDYGPPLVRLAWFLVGFVLAALLGWFVVEPLVSRFVRRRNRNNPTIEEAITRYVRLLVVLVAVLVGAGFAGYGQLLSDSALVVAAGTLAVGVAAQTVVGSLVSGLVLVVDPEFGVGSYIEWGEYEGTVRSIELRSTRVATPDGELITVPNTTLTSEPIVRPFGLARHRLVHRVGVAYDDDLEVVLDRLAAAADGLDRVADQPSPEAVVDEFDADAVIVRVRYWIQSPSITEIADVRSDFARAAKANLEDAGVTISPASDHDLSGRIEVTEPA